MIARDIARRGLAGGTVGVIATIMYHGTQFLGADRAVLRAHCNSWHWLAFRPEWFWPYCSVFLLMGIPWFTLRRWTSVRNFGVTFVTVASVAWATFVVYPTACVRPPVDAVPAYLAALYQLDWPNNCFPCLHAVLAIFGAYGAGCDVSLQTRLLWRSLLGMWALVILMSIIALRQHTGIDVFCGVILGVVAIGLFRRLEGPTPGGAWWRRRGGVLLCRATSGPSRDKPAPTFTPRHRDPGKHSVHAVETSVNIRAIETRAVGADFTPRSLRREPDCGR